MEWIGGRFFVMPQAPLSGRFHGVVERVETRTWAGCSFGPEEAGDYPFIPVLRIGEVLALLKRTTPDLADELQRQAALWRPRSGYVGAGPPYVRDEDAWADETPPGTTELSGFWYPAFDAGTIQGWQIWGLYVTKWGDARSP